MYEGEYRLSTRSQYFVATAPIILINPDPSTKPQGNSAVQIQESLKSKKKYIEYEG